MFKATLTKSFFLYFRFFRNSYGVVCALKVRNDDVVYCSMPLYHSAAGILGVGLCFVGGCTLALRRKFSASSFWDDCIETKATVSVFCIFNVQGL